MLDKMLCEALGVDKFTQWLVARLDWLEAEMNSPDVSPCKYIDLKAQHEAIVEARDAYKAFKQGNLEVVSLDELIDEDEDQHEDESDPPVHMFKLSIFDTESNPSRFYKLTHHFDWICPLDLYPDVTVSDVNVDIYIVPGGYNVIVHGLISGDQMDDALSDIDLEDWGNATLINIEVDRVIKHCT